MRENGVRDLIKLAAKFQRADMDKLTGYASESESVDEDSSSSSSSNSDMEHQPVNYVNEQAPAQEAKL
jgi:hypothetical protein